VAVAELLANGRLDPGFGDGGVELSGFKLLPWQVLALPDGKVLILGPNRYPGTQELVITRFPDWQILRLLPDGQPDPSFGHGGFLIVSGVPVASEGPTHRFAPQLAPNGDILLPTVSGRLFSPEMTSGLVRLNPDGSRDTSFGSAGVLQMPDGLSAFSMDSTGSTVVTTGTRSGTRLMRLTPAGSPDPAFNGGSPLRLPADDFDSLLVEPDGAIELHGYPSSNHLLDSRIWRCTSFGALDTSWGSGGSIDLGPTAGYMNQLLPASGGGSLLVTMGILSRLGAETDHARIIRLTPGGQADPTEGGVNGLLVDLPFGGGSYAPGAIANLHQNSFSPTGVIERAGGTLLFNGSVRAGEELPTEGDDELIAGITGFALAAFDDSFRLEPAFTGATRLRLTARIASTRLRSNGIAVRLRSSHAALSVVTVTAAGRTIARGTVPFFSIDSTVGSRTARIPLTGAGRRLLRRHRRRVTVTVKVSAADLVANRASTRTSTTLAG
jgi:uncharacterized delta-60 repeat protein